MNFKKRSRQSFIDKNFISKISDGKFILFPLQTDSEGAILLDAPLFTNQIEVIKQISKSMPIDYKLLVKEHPASFLRSWRSVGEYKELRDIPGVVLIHPSANSQELMKKSSLVISICSSSSLDAQFLEKPSIIFADTNFSMIPSIQKVKEIEKLPELTEDKDYYYIEFPKIASNNWLTKLTYDSDKKINESIFPEYEEKENSNLFKFKKNGIPKKAILNVVVTYFDWDKQTKSEYNNIIKYQL